MPDIRRLLNRCINENLQGTMDNDQLRAITYATQSMSKIFELLSIERRLDRLGQKMANRHKTRIKQLEKKLKIGKPGVLCVIQQAGETKEQAIERTKKQYPNIKEYDLIFVMNFSNVGTKTRQD